MIYHTDFEEHQYERNMASQLAKVSDNWVKRFSVDSTSSENLMHVDFVASNQQLTNLTIGWAIPKRHTRRLNFVQKSFLNKVFDDGEVNKSKVSAEKALQMMKGALQPNEFLPLTSIKSYFSRRAKNIREGKSFIGEILQEKCPKKHKPDVVNKGQNDNDKISDGDDDIDEDSYEMNLDGYNDGEDESEKIAERANLIQKIIVGTDVPDLQPDEWVAVIIGSQWYPAQFETYDKESEQIKVNVLHRSSTDPKWFIWPQLDLNGAEHVEWVVEDDILFRLKSPKEGRRQVLLFEEVDEVEELFTGMK